MNGTKSQNDVLYDLASTFVHMIKKWIVIAVKEWHILIYVFITFIFEFAQKIIDAWFLWVSDLNIIK